MGWHGLDTRIMHIDRIIRASSNIGDIVLDPFSRTFTTSSVAQTLGRESSGIAAAVIDIINAYAKTKQASFAGFIKTCEQLQDISKQKHDKVETFVLGLLAPNVDTRIFEIVSYAILKFFYHDQTVYFGFQSDAVEKSPLVLYKTGRTNANDGGMAGRAATGSFEIRSCGWFYKLSE